MKIKGHAIYKSIKVLIIFKTHYFKSNEDLYNLYGFLLLNLFFLVFPKVLFALSNSFMLLADTNYTF
jgi:hypothetical protein